MSANAKIQSLGPRPLAINATRTRQAAPSSSVFGSIMRTGANLLVEGASVAASAVGMPVMSAAISRARIGSNGIGSNTYAQTMAGGTSGTDVAAKAVTTASAQDQRHANDMQLLEMQAQIQAHNRQITLASNIMKAKHDTEKAAISNIRA